MSAIEPTSTVVLPTSAVVSTASPSLLPRKSVQPTPVVRPVPSTTQTKAAAPSPDIDDPEVEVGGIILGLELYPVIGIGAGVGLSVIAVIIAAVLIIFLCVRYKRRKKRSWSPQKSFKSNGTSHIDSVSVRPANGHSNGKVVTLSKTEEAELELDEKPTQSDNIA
jgi:hypothetical protein